MASRLYLRNITSGIGTALQYMLPTRGGSVVTNTVSLTNGGNNIAWTQSAGGTVAEWVSPRVPSGGFTLSGNITFNGWFRESNANDNCGVRARVYRRTPGGTDTEVNGSPFAFGGGTPTEFTTTIGAKNWTGTPGAGLAFSEDDRIVVRFEAIAAGGSMTVGTADHTTNGGTAAATGDSYIEITENVSWKTETITKTIKTSGGDFSLLSTWESANQSDLVTDNVIAQAECYAGEFSDALNLNGWTTSASNYIRVYTPTAERHNGRSRDASGVGFQITSPSSHTITIQEDYVRLEGLAVKTSGTTHSAIIGLGGTITATTNEWRIENCVCFNPASNTWVAHLALDTDLNVILRNNIFYGTGSGVNVSSLASTVIEHNTVHVTSTVGLQYTGNNHSIRNNYVGGATTCFTGGTPGTFSHNASTDATADDDGATGALINLTAADQFVTVATDNTADFHLKSGNSLNGAGTPIAAVTLDIDGDTRSGSAPSIGADEITAVNNTVNVTNVVSTGAVGNVVPQLTPAVTGVSATGQVGTAIIQSRAIVSWAEFEVPVEAGDATPTITGVSATGSVGTVTPVLIPAITGVSATGQLGEEIPTLVPAITGVSATGQTGTVALVVDDTQAVTGVEATGQTGTLVPVIIPTITGVSATGQTGTVAVVVDDTQAVTGVSATGQTGTVTPVLVPAITGVSSTGNTGTVTPVLVISVTGVSATGAIGDVTAGAGAQSRAHVTWVEFEVPSQALSRTVNVTGVSATGQTGTVVPNVIVPVTGVSATGQTGTAVGASSTNTNVNVTGVSATGAIGTIFISPYVDVEGVSATGAVGDVNIANIIIPNITGVQATGQIGTTSVSNTIEIEGVSATGLLTPDENSLVVIPNLRIVVPTGVSATGQIGNLGVPETVVSVTGVQATARIGSFLLIFPHTRPCVWAPAVKKSSRNFVTKSYSRRSR